MTSLKEYFQRCQHAGWLRTQSLLNSPYGRETRDDLYVAVYSEGGAGVEVYKVDVLETSTRVFIQRSDRRTILTVERSLNASDY
jgi:hypothetical protein